MSAYAVARLTDAVMGPGIVEYLKRIDATLEPFNGHFLIHGGPINRLEGAWSGDLIMIGFPTMESARAWYESPAYREILPLRTMNSKGDVILIEGVSPDHRASDILEAVTA
ncbi:DUF1330 domain-containing protein [Microvirga sp. ACRRW]|uniref:DUF1330 domain-containing protein n=1 Tax=Microvirga sp. ACRRW TaxID=2918205 RepID=UPI001EF6DC0A|nr:DUF1330 domain-containing protein [Microvirga sp. ACRRW]MCG7392886.1 DUF1330 domain-containing protein [Microvirga sp. ACRRW]